MSNISVRKSIVLLVGAPEQIIEPLGIPSQEAFGLPTILVSQTISNAGGIVSQEAFGLPTVNVGQPPTQFIDFGWPGDPTGLGDPTLYGDSTDHGDPNLYGDPTDHGDPNLYGDPNKK